MYIIDTVKDAIGSMRYGSKGEVALYWFLRIGFYALCVLVVLVIVGFVYCKMKGIDIVFPF